MLSVLKVFVLIFALVFLATLSSSIIIEQVKRRKVKSISSEEQKNKDEVNT